MKQGPGRWMSVLLLVLSMAATAWAGSSVAPRNAMGLNAGYTYDPHVNTCFAQLSLSRLYDYDDVWPHAAPEALRFKVETGLGLSRLESGDVRANINANIMALYYLDALSTPALRPYVEAGIGVAYTDYRVDGQAYRFNFNPQAGVGMAFCDRGLEQTYLALRAHHISNAGLSSDNRGMNSVVLMVGRFF